MALKPRLALIALLSVPAYYLAFTAFNKRLRATIGQERTEYGRMSTDLQEAITGIRVIQIFHREGYISGKFGERLDQYLAAVRAYLRSEALASTATTFISQLVPASVRDRALQRAGGHPSGVPPVGAGRGKGNVGCLARICATRVEYRPIRRPETACERSAAALGRDARGAPPRS
ncbi:ABC transporter ATP-binding protein [Symbiobacterium terraclitae]|uniref:ABC transporter ATP-binding protein n=1 Tax=Symbiobacterium terraclitae TaxID=557451 RepID=UPI0035B56B1C